MYRYKRMEEDLMIQCEKKMQQVRCESRRLLDKAERALKQKEILNKTLKERDKQLSQQLKNLKKSENLSGVELANLKAEYDSRVERIIESNPLNRISTWDNHERPVTPSLELQALRSQVKQLKEKKNITEKTVEAVALPKNCVDADSIAMKATRRHYLEAEAQLHRQLQAYRDELTAKEVSATCP